MNLHKKCTYDAHTRLGSLEPIVIYFRRVNPPIPFYITQVAYAQLNDSQGKCYGRTPFGPWCCLKIFAYEVVGIRTIHDPKVIEEIENDLYS